jgi:quercetin dioxygenase-like cupin family protein
MQNQFWLLGIHRTILEDAEATDLHYDIVEGVSHSGNETPSHIHSEYSEFITVLDGELTIYTDEKTVILKPGEHFYIQKGTPHALSITGNVLSRTLTVFSPSGFGKVIRTVGVPGTVDKLPETAADMDLFVKLSAEIGDIILGPPGSRPKQLAESKDRRDIPED